MRPLAKPTPVRTAPSSATLQLTSVLQSAPAAGPKCHRSHLLRQQGHPWVQWSALGRPAIDEGNETVSFRFFHGGSRCGARRKKEASMMYETGNCEARPRKRWPVASIAAAVLGAAVLCQPESAAAFPHPPMGGLPHPPMGGLPRPPGGGFPRPPAVASRGRPAGFPGSPAAERSPAALAMAPDLPDSPAALAMAAGSPARPEAMAARPAVTAVA